MKVNNHWGLSDTSYTIDNSPSAWTSTDNIVYATYPTIDTLVHKIMNNFNQQGLLEIVNFLLEHRLELSPEIGDILDEMISDNEIAAELLRASLEGGE